MRIAENVEMLEVPGRESGIYPTLTWDKERLVLMDTGYPGQAELIARAIVAAGFSAERLTHIIITHQDIDHIGCALDLLKLAPLARVMAHQEEAPYIDGRRTPIKLATLLENYANLSADDKAWCDRMKEGFANRKVAIEQNLTDGEILPICGGIEVIHTPGHTPGHICLLLQESGIMVCGDAINIKDGEVAGPNPRYTFDMELGLQSMEKALKYPIKALVAYHGGYLRIAGED
ncbi:MAG: MBL fold metallo-hydrolase [Clostridiales bacterium]|nr:MBL fold metallo-hydrolase [Clostridiales bacterium]